MDQKNFIGKIQKYKNVSNEELREEVYLEIKEFIEEQKEVILRLDKDVEHEQLYYDELWKEVNSLNIQTIIDNPKEYLEKINTLKLRVLDRNYNLMNKVIEIRELILIHFQIDILKDIENKVLATMEQHNSKENGKYFGIINREILDDIRKILTYRQKIVDINSSKECDEYRRRLEYLEKNSDWIDKINIIIKSIERIKTMQDNKLVFSEKCEKQIRSITVNEDEEREPFDELQLSIYMTVFGQYFDDRNPLDVSEEDINRIIKKVWIQSAGSKIDELGKVYMSKEQYEEFCNINNESGSDEYIKEKTKWILLQIRNSIMHGSFEVYSQDSQKLIDVFGEKFKCTFKFECLIDICEELFKTSKSKDMPDSLEELLKAVKEKNSNKAKEILLSNKLDLFDLYVNSVLTYNEDFFHKNKDIIFTGITEIDETMKNDGYIGSIRNSVIHRHRKIEDGEIIILDGKNENSLSEKVRYNFEKFMNFIKDRCLITKIRENMRSRIEQEI